MRTIFAGYQFLTENVSRLTIILVSNDSQFLMYNLIL